MSYLQTIAEGIGVEVTKANRPMLEELEDIMRNTIFHSTLDWQTREQLHRAAREAKDVYDYARTPEGRALIASIRRTA